MEKAIRIILNSKAIGPTGIVKKHLAASPHERQIVLQIANEILNGEDMCHNWKTSTVVPIYKKDNFIDCASKAFRAWYKSGGKVEKDSES